MSARTAESEAAAAGCAVTVNAPTAANVATAARVRARGRRECRGRHATGWPVSFFRLPPTGLAVGFGRGRDSPYDAKLRRRFTPRGTVGSPAPDLDSAVRSTARPLWPGCHGTV